MFPRNTAALRLYEKLGSRRKGVLRDHYRRRDGELRDAVLMVPDLHER